MHRILKKVLWLIGLAGVSSALYALLQKQGERVLRPTRPREAASPSSGGAAARPAAEASTGRCAATTNSGSRCTRPAEDGGRYCWQHAAS